jgi:hypothetical protein
MGSLVEENPVLSFSMFMQALRGLFNSFFSRVFLEWNIFW